MYISSPSFRDVSNPPENFAFLPLMYMLISERGVPSSFSTLFLNSSPMSSEILVNASASFEAEIVIFFSPAPLFRTEGIVKVMFGRSFHPCRNLYNIRLHNLWFLQYLHQCFCCL